MTKNSFSFLPNGTLFIRSFRPFHNKHCTYPRIHIHIIYTYTQQYTVFQSLFFFFHLTTGNTGIRVKIVLYRDAETERVNNTLSNVVWCRFSGIVLRRTKKLRTRSSGPSTRTFIYVYIIHI